MNILSLHLLRSFIAVVEEKTFHAASIKMNLTQSAISQQMAQLEEGLNTVLFQRVGRNKEPTELGLKLYVEAKKMFQLNDFIFSEIGRTTNEPCSVD